MKWKILSLATTTMILLACIPSYGGGTQPIIQDKPRPEGFWAKEHTIHIFINSIFVYECGDDGSREPDEYYFFLFAFPKFWHFTTDIYEVYDNHPNVPYDFDKLGAFKTRFTPEILFLFAIENDKRDDLNTNEFMGMKRINFNPPKGNYTAANPYSEKQIVWDVPQYFKAFITINFHA